MSETSKSGAMGSVAEQEPLTIAQAHSDPLNQMWSALRGWWLNIVIQDIDQLAVVRKIKDESGLTPRYIFMTCMSAGIAILGLILSSPAVVIGAMLLSPLMGPILGAGFALATGDAQWLKESGKALAAGTIFAILFCALIVLLSPLQTVTSEIASRTRPNLFDLAVALFSALAGSYAMIRGREGTIVGVAIATALMPPLAVVGFGLATANWTVFGGSLLLFVTNLMTIALSAAVMARLYGFRTSLSATQSMMQSIFIFICFVALAVPLGFSLKSIAWETNAQRQISNVIKDQFDEKARISALDINFGSNPIKVNASVLTPEFVSDAEAKSSKMLSRSLDFPIAVNIDQFRVGTGAGDVDAAQIAAAKAQEQAIADERKMAQLGERLALIAGVKAQDVLIDRSRKRAVVKAKPLAGATLATYYELEGRVAALEPGWTLLVEPPALALPDIGMLDNAPSETGQNALALIIWAAARVDAPIGLAGDGKDVDAILALLQEKNIRAVRRASIPRRTGMVTVRWLAPDEAAAAN
ncbi:DUF389 domain-containing protein [Sphingorhabdus arenilitoris]|uniref:DUF389 domain-containing protein n=1 Tax=Sphingorhabdus arenilitoris TaxID=1490041 RepID=A0ABV8RI03_9SPHN